MGRAHLKKRNAASLIYTRWISAIGKLRGHWAAWHYAGGSKESPSSPTAISSQSWLLFLAWQLWTRELQFLSWQLAGGCFPSSKARTSMSRPLQHLHQARKQAANHQNIAADLLQAQVNSRPGKQTRAIHCVECQQWRSFHWCNVGSAPVVLDPIKLGMLPSNSNLFRHKGAPSGSWEVENVIGCIQKDAPKQF